MVRQMLCGFVLLFCVLSQTAKATIVDTQNVFDLALIGDGMFAVRDPQGKVTYTRDGAFKPRYDQFLVQKSTGLVLLDNAGHPIKLLCDEPKVLGYRIDDDGSITAIMDDGKVKLVAYVGVSDRDGVIVERGLSQIWTIRSSSLEISH